MGRRPTLIYASRREAILQLSWDGMTPEQIAEAINRAHPGAGMTGKGVACYIGRLRQAGEAVPVAVRLNQALYAKLHRAAYARGSRPDHLATQLLSAILNDGLVDAVLDDNPENGAAA